jgi:hypothetical protein
MTMHTIKQTTGLALALTLSVFGPALADDPKTPNLAAYAGHYELAPGFQIVITYEANHLFAQVTDQEKAEVFPAGPNEIAWKIVDAKATFEAAPDGHVTGLVLHQGGNDVPAKRVN